MLSEPSSGINSDTTVLPATSAKTIPPWKTLLLDTGRLGSQDQLKLRYAQDL